jgi:hypothetical protein
MENMKTDLELTEIAAKWLGWHVEDGIPYDKYALPLFVGGTVTFVDNPFNWIPFDPLNNQNALWNMVVPKLPDGSILIVPHEGKFWIDNKQGNLSDLPRAILELVAEIYESEAKG